MANGSLTERVLAKSVRFAVVIWLILKSVNNNTARIKAESQSSSKRQAMIQEPFSMLAKINQGVIPLMTGVLAAN